MGAPSAARWARIWCVRPVRGQSPASAGSEAPEARLGLEPVSRPRDPPPRAGAVPRQAERAGAGGREPARGDREIRLPGGPGAEAGGERGGRRGRLAEDHDPAGVAIQPVHQPRLAAEVIRGEEEEAGEASWRGLRGEARRLVHREHLGVLVEHAERPGRGQRGGGAPAGLLEHHQHLGPGSDREGRVALPAAAQVDRPPGLQGARLVARAAQAPGHHVGERTRVCGAEGAALHPRIPPALALTGGSGSWQRRPP